MGAPEFDGKDLNDALDAASEALGVPSAEIDFEILEGGRKGVFGLGAKPVRIRVAPSGPQPEKSTTANCTPRAAAPGPDHAPSLPAATLREIIEKMGFDLRVEELRRDGSLELKLDGPDRKRLTAKDGELLAALEFVLSRMGRRAWPDESPVHLTCRGFRSERDDEIIQLVREAAAEVGRSGRPHLLQAMNPYERRVVHMAIREHPGLTTVSEGDGFLKRVRLEKIAP
jgi:spoIIIJ-associated protein